MHDQNKNNQQEQEWHPPMQQPPPPQPAHPPELRFQEERRHNSTRNLILSYKQSKLQTYDPIMREVLCDALLTMDERITTLEERMCFFESSGAILQKPHMNVEEVARYLGYTTCSIYNLTRRKQIPFYEKYIVMRSEQKSNTVNQIDTDLLLRSTSHNDNHFLSLLSQSRRFLLDSQDLSEARFGVRSVYAFSSASRLAFESARA